jgi:hypothetical protein
MARKPKQEYSEASQLLDRFTFEISVHFKDENACRFLVVDVRARSLTEAKHLVVLQYRNKDNAFVQEWVRTYHHGRDRSWLREGHKNYYPQIVQVRQYDRAIYERLLKERNAEYAVQ